MPDSIHSSCNVSRETIPVPTINGIQDEVVYNCDSFDFVANCGTYSRIRTKHKQCIDQFGTFDIETYSRKCDEPYAWMYHWQMCINGTVVFGRRWEEFMYFLKRLTEYYNSSPECPFIIYVHNLSYEFQFIKSFFDWHDVFLKKEHKILKATTVTGLEFRCSYFLSNCSLDLFLKNNNAIHRKVKSELIDDDEGYNYDYEKYRTADTPLTYQEKSYCYNDVKGPYEAITELIKEDTLISIPLTSTSYVRRDMRNALKTSRKYTRFIHKMALDLDMYNMCREAFRGGDTHAQYHTAEQILDDIDAYDISSSYPYVIMTKKFPMSQFIEVDNSRFDEYYKSGKCLLFKLRLEDVHIRDTWDMPYLSYSKCRNIKNAKCDNGRILSADSIELTVTDIDYAIIRDVYNIKTEHIGRIYAADSGYLPTPIREVTLEYFRLKTVIKDKIRIYKNRIDTLSAEEKGELLDMRKNYVKSKNKLNGIYGMFATDPVVDKWVFENLKGSKCEIDTEESLNEHYSKYSTFLCYQWGIWVTAHARYRLHEIRCLKRGMTVYNDTDSVYVPREFGQYIESYNKNVIQEIMSAPIPPYVDVSGKRYYMGTVELDGTYSKFITCGSKRYACITTEGKIKVTVAGLAKSAGEESLKELGFEAFKPGWTVERSGNMTAYYNDKPSHYIEEGGCRMLTGSNVALFPASYELNRVRDYKDLIGYIESIRS